MVVWRCNYIIFLFSLWPEGPEKFFVCRKYISANFSSISYYRWGKNGSEKKKKLKKGPFCTGFFYMWKKKKRIKVTLEEQVE